MKQTKTTNKEVFYTATHTNFGSLIPNHVVN